MLSSVGKKARMHWMKQNGESMVRAHTHKQAHTSWDCLTMWWSVLAADAESPPASHLAVSGCSRNLINFPNQRLPCCSLVEDDALHLIFIFQHLWQSLLFAGRLMEVSCRNGQYPLHITTAHVVSPKASVSKWQCFLLFVFSLCRWMLDIIFFLPATAS